ncbi:MAG: LPS export ABC transporter periplasmic protein LptC [Brevinematia bacterium]
MKKLFFVVFLTIWFCSCYYDVEPPIIKVEPKVGTNNVLLIAEEFKYMGTDYKSSKKMWELIAKKSVIYKDSNVDLEGIEVKFFKRGYVISFLKGDKGKLYPNQNRTEITGNVVLENYQNKTKIMSSRLIWDGNEKVIYNTSSDKTVIVSPSATLRGSGLRTTPDVYPLELENVEAVIQ